MLPQIMWFEECLRLHQIKQSDLCLIPKYKYKNWKNMRNIKKPIDLIWKRDTSHILRPQ